MKNIKYYSVDEIVDINDNAEHVDKIVEAFLEQQNKYSNIIDDGQLHNMRLLAQILCCKGKTDKPVVVPIPMGQGKSKILVEFIKYMYKHYKDFGAIIVKKTLEECKEFVIDLGLRDRKYQHLCIDNSIEYMEGNPFAKQDLMGIYSRDERQFIGKVVRGFNFSECSEYGYGKGNDSGDTYRDYDFRLCYDCHKKGRCKVSLSKNYAQNHRIIAITHQRLFISNDVENMIEDLMCFTSDNGELIKRSIIIIDEKIDMVDIGNITYIEFNEIRGIVNNKGDKETTDLFSEIDDYLIKLEYPESCKDNVIKQSKVFKENFKFDDDLIKLVLKESESMDTIINLIKLERMLSTENVTTGRRFNKKQDKQVCGYRYIDIGEFCKQFDKSIILDSTSIKDVDYHKSDVLCVGNVIQRDWQISIHHCNINMSKSSMAGGYKSISNELAQEIKHIVETHGKKTLIVCYRNVYINSLKKDLEDKLNILEVDENLFTVIHHGQYTTGTNKFNDFEIMIILGNLNKGHQYYQNKCYALNLGNLIENEDTSIDERIKINDYLVSEIQQIGRSALRQKKHVDIYMFNTDSELMGNLEGYFNTSLNVYKPQYLQLKENAYTKIINFISEKCVDIGDRIKKQQIKNCLNLKKSTYTSAMKKNEEDFIKWKKTNNIKEQNNYFEKVCNG